MCWMNDVVNALVSEDAVVAGFLEGPISSKTKIEPNQYIYLAQEVQNPWRTVQCLQQSNGVQLL